MSTGQTCAEDDAEDVSSMAFLQAIVQASVGQIDEHDTQQQMRWVKLKPLAGDSPMAKMKFK